MPRTVEPTLEISGDVVALPPYLVREPKIPDFKERELLTPEGKLRLAYKRHPGLRFTLPFLSNDGIARAMIEEEFEVERIAEMRDLQSIYYSDPKGGKETKRLIDEALTKPIGPSH